MESSHSIKREDLDLFPTQAGVYLMKGKDGTILYVGKAKNLRQRVRQYFAPGGDGRLMIPFLISKVETVDTIVVFSEKEALLLENTLIKQHKPRYNALLKDDKSYIALKVNNKHEWPMVSLVRYKGVPQPDGLYFGPYTSADSARKTLDLIHKIFPLRECSDDEFSRRKRPCILYDMQRCIAPCVNKCTKEEYYNHVVRTLKFLRGQDREVLKDLYDSMQKAVDKLEFEKAASLHRTILHIEGTLESQVVDKPFGIDFDALAIFREGDEVVLTQLIFRGGKLVGSRHYDFKAIAEDDSELISTFIIQHYLKVDTFLPREIILPKEIEDISALEEILAGDKKNVKLIAPQRGEKKVFAEMAYINAEARFRKEKDQRTIREKILLECQDKFRLKNYPKRIECFDISNIAGTSTVATLVTFTEGFKDSSRYRKYKIRTIEGMNDYGSMQEALERRYKRALAEDDLPDLLIVDGGKGHLNMAVKVLSDLNIISVDVISLAKEEGRHDKGSTIEQVFLPGLKDPILLRKTSPVLFLLQQIRDEAHRTAITYYRKLQIKKNVRSALEDIPGIGPAKRKILLNHFGSLKKLLEADEETLKKLKGLSEVNILNIMQFVFTKKAKLE